MWFLVGRGSARGQLHGHAVDREVGTEHLAEVAVHTRPLLHDDRDVVALAIEVLRAGQHVARAEFDAEPATFAPVAEDAPLAVRHGDLSRIEWSAPVFHASSPPSSRAGWQASSRSWCTPTWVVAVLQRGSSAMSRPTIYGSAAAPRPVMRL